MLGALALLFGACGGDVSDDGGGGATTTPQGTGGGGATTATGGTSAGGGGTAGAGGTAAGGGVGTAGSGGGNGIRCNPSTVLCDAPTPVCPVGEVPSVIGACWGSCVPILSCETEASCDDCQGGFCAEYQAWTTEYRCVAPSLQCSALACSCLAPYFCVGAFDSCQEVSTGDHVVTCSCPSC
jgi:hypothetical protein